MPNSIKRWNGSTWATVYPDAVEANTAGTIVLRGTGGNFSAGTITASLSGNATTATSLANSPTINNVTFAGNANITVPRLRALDDRIVVPADFSSQYVTATFTSWNNDNNSPYADALVCRTYSDSSGGLDNMLALRKDTLGLRVWQHTFGSATAFSTFKDVAWTDGSNATGTWAISTSGNAGTATTLQNARTINGVSFNGSANITVTVGTAEINNNAVTNAKLNNSTGEIAGAWQTFTPVIGGGTHNGTKVGRYLQVGKTVDFMITLTWATGDNFSGLVVNLPVTAQTNINTSQIQVMFGDGLTPYTGTALVSTTNMTIYAVRSNQTYADAVTISNTIPFTWGAGDTVQIAGRYEAA